MLKPSSAKCAPLGPMGGAEGRANAARIVPPWYGWLIARTPTLIVWQAQPRPSTYRCQFVQPK